MCVAVRCVRPCVVCVFLLLSTLTNRLWIYIYIYVVCTLRLYVEYILSCLLAMLMLYRCDIASHIFICIYFISHRILYYCRWFFFRFWFFFVFVLFLCVHRVRVHLAIEKLHFVANWGICEKYVISFGCWFDSVKFGKQSIDWTFW